MLPAYDSSTSRRKSRACNVAHQLAHKRVSGYTSRVCTLLHTKGQHQLCTRRTWLCKPQRIRHARLRTIGMGGRMQCERVDVRNTLRTCNLLKQIMLSMTRRQVTQPRESTGKAPRTTTGANPYDRCAANDRDGNVQGCTSVVFLPAAVHPPPPRRRVRE